jgi:hypothetical protein
LAIGACTHEPQNAPDASSTPPGEHLPANIRISQGLGPDYTSVTASFDDRRDYAESMMSGCIELNYPPDSYTRSFDAGSLTVSGANIRAVIKPFFDSYWKTAFYSYRSMSRELVDGETLTIATSGAVVPSFSTTLDAPSVATFAKPPSVVIKVGEPFDVSWTGGGGDVVIRWSSTLWSLECPFPASAGHATVPAEVTARLYGDGGSVSFFTRTESVLALMPWDVRVSASTGGIWPDGSAAYSLFTFEH